MKNYSIQPYLGYNDLFNIAETAEVAEPTQEESVATEQEATMEATEEASEEIQVTEEVPTEIVADEAVEVESPSITPIIIIAVVAVVLVIVVVVILRKKKK
jgi:cobalamin biosynthesis Mg chelatase CobN